MKLVLAIALIALAAGPVRADDTADRVAAEASAHFDRGVALVKRGDQLAALAEFDAAYALVPDWKFLFNIGLTEKALFRYGTAIQTLERYLTEGGDQIDADRRSKVEAELAELRRLVAEVVVSVAGAPASIEIDNEAVGTTPFDAPLLVAPGDHVIRASRAGEVPDEKTISVVSGDHVEVALAPHPAPKVVTTGHITIVSRPDGATISVDDGPARPSPWTGELARGGHHVTAALAGYRVEHTEVVVEAGQQRTVPIELTTLPRPIYRRRTFWIAVAAVSLAAAVGGGIYLSQPELPDVRLRW